MQQRLNAEPPSAAPGDERAFRAFVDEWIVPHAQEFEREEAIPLTLVRELGARGYLGAAIPREYGGAGMNLVSLGRLHEEIGHGCSSVRSLLTVQDMVMQTILKWGDRARRQDLLPRLSRGDLVAAFALTEPQAGSDPEAISMMAEERDGGFALTGRKVWTTCGRIAGLFLVIARCPGGPAAFLVDRQTPGLTVHPVRDLLGVRASMVADLEFVNCFLPASALIGRVGFGLSHVAATALDFGRYSVAWGCVGLARACLEASVHYASERRQYGSPLTEHQLIQQMITDMLVGVEAARLLAERAGQLRDARDPRTIVETMMAKYLASTTATRAATNAVQIHGAVGCTSRYHVERFFRDARIMEIIEGSTQMQQIVIARYGSHGITPYPPETC